MSAFLAFCLLLHLSPWTLTDATKKDKVKHRSPEEQQGHLIKTLAEYDITYPTEMDHRGQVTDHVTTLSSHTRRRRSLSEETGPIIYQVHFKGQTIKMVLKLNSKLFGSDFTIERHKEDGTIETKTAAEQCYLVGETELLHTSVAISDCDGLAGIIDLGNDTIYIEPVLNRSLIVHKGWTRPGRAHLVYRKAMLDSNQQHNLAVDQYFSDEYPTGLNGTISLPDMKFPDMLKGNPKYIEVMATADSSVIKFHGKDKSEKYILTLMNIVSRLYQHKSIGARVYFVVVKLVLLENDPKEIKINGQPMPSLSSVCYWGHKARKGFDSTTKDFYDHTVFITRKDFGPSGYAPVNGMCYRMRSCTLNEEDGFASAFIIAHETGHTLGMEHDGVNNNCSNDVIKGSIMAPLVRSRFDRFYWSPCSRRDLVSRLRSLWCLNDVPFRNNIPHLQKLPGQIYTIHEQCQREFGDHSRFCSGMKRDPCKELWCSRLSYVNFNNRYCQTRREPALEGTKCGLNKWCRLGKCVPIDDGDFIIPISRPTMKPTHGGWSYWSELSACSKSCGVGVQYRTRKCNNPVPKNDGRPCEGMDIKFEVCNVKDCPGKPQTFDQIRNEQCQRRAPLVAAGTRGKRWSSYDIHSATIDCDFENDLCGWANDVKDDYDWRRNRGRTPTAGTGPSTDHTKGKLGHYVFLETSRPISPGWKARLVSKYIGMRVACLKFWYHAFGGDIHMGQLQLIVQTDAGEKLVWSVNENRGNRWVLKYATIISKKPYRIIFQGIRGDGYLSDFGLDDISLENNPCGLGLMRLTTINNQIAVNPCHQFCEAENDKHSDVVEVEVENGTACHDSLGLYDVCIQGQCQTIDCDGVMGSNKTLDTCGVCGGNDDTCYETAGSITTLPKEDLQTLLECPVGATNIMFEDSSPNDLVLVASGTKKPQIDVTDEEVVSMAYEFAGSKFTYRRKGDKEAITSLGPIKDRIMVKVKIRDQGATGTAPVNLRFQFYKPNSTGLQHYWSHFKWSDCSRTCGEGIQTRIFKCLRQENDTEVEERNCYSSNKPAPLTRFCNLTDCESYVWKVSEWSECSSPCNGGSQTRTIECRGLQTNIQGNSTLCSAGALPETEQDCNVQPCPAQWIVGNWTKCSTTCGNGRQYRSVSCRGILGDVSLDCPRDLRPLSRMTCKNEPCEGETFRNMSCSFEKGFCHWKNLENSRVDHFDWTLWNGSTPSRNTGPSNDHTLGTSKGVYAYTEASEPQQRNDRARLISAMIQPGKVCLEFWYHMYGTNMGWLRVLSKSPHRRERRLWYKYGNQLNEWHRETLSIFSYVKYQIIMEGIRGRGFSSDIALDDIKITRGGCPEKITEADLNNCKGDKSRYCTVAIQLNWCSTIKWRVVCCKTCERASPSGRQ